jgi:hypothetical protein
LITCPGDGLVVGNINLQQLQALAPVGVFLTQGLDGRVAQGGVSGAQQYRYIVVVLKDGPDGCEPDAFVGAGDEYVFDGVSSACSALKGNIVILQSTLRGFLIRRRFF